MATKKEDSILEISALSRPLHLGTLYNARNDCIVPGRNLWKDDEIHQNTILYEQASTKYDVKITESFDEKTELLDVSGSLKASICVGLVDVKGSAEYLKSQVTSTYQCSATMQYHVTTVSKKLKISDMKVHYPEVFKEREPTHVVIEVLYGADAFMEFQYMANDEAEKRNFQGNLKVMVKNIPIVEVDGDGKIKLSPEEKKKVQNLSCKFYGDFILKENPYTYEEAVKVYKELPSLLGEKKENAVPVKVWLYPLKRLNDIAAKLTNEISECVLSETGKVIEDLHQARVRTSDLLEKYKSLKAVDIIHKLERFQTCLRTFAAEFLQKLRKLLPAIRGGTAEESALRDELTSLRASGFSKKEMDAWLSGKTTEIEVVTSVIREICDNLQCEIKCPGPELELYLCTATKDVVMFCFTSLNNEEPYLRKIEKSSVNVSPPVQGTVISPWYITPTAQKALDVFKSQKDCDKIMSFITDPDHPGASVRVYQQNKLKYKNLKCQTRTTFNYKLRFLNVSENDYIRENLEAIPLRHRSAKHLRFLVYGPVGHGKSSFINSVNSVFQEHVCMGALVATQSDRSFTLQYKTHQIKSKQKRALPFVFSDIMGLERADMGIKLDDVMTCLGGHARDNYKFSVLTQLREGDVKYNNNPSVNDKVHCLVTVVSAEKIRLLPDSIIKKMKDIIRHATDMGIPVAVVMTHVDKACLEVKRDLSNISSSLKIKTEMKVCRDRLEVDMSCILPVKNYYNETRVDPKVDCLILRAFKELVLCANSYIECL